MATQPKRFGPEARTERQADADRRAVHGYRRWYGLRRWRARAAAQLADCPYCIRCAAEGFSTQARVADHVTPHRGDYDAFWYGPLQSLCKPHHDSAKQAEERASAAHQRESADARGRQHLG